jgi:hypothetical protein
MARTSPRSFASLGRAITRTQQVPTMRHSRPASPQSRRTGCRPARKAVFAHDHAPAAGRCVQRSARRPPPRGSQASHEESGPDSKESRALARPLVSPLTPLSPSMALSPRLRRSQSHNRDRRSPRRPFDPKNSPRWARERPFPRTGRIKLFFPRRNCGRGFLHPARQGQTHRHFRAGQEAVVAIVDPVIFRRMMSERPSPAYRNHEGGR